MRVIIPRCIPEKSGLLQDIALFLSPDKTGYWRGSINDSDRQAYIEKCEIEGDITHGSQLISALSADIACVSEPRDGMICYHKEARDNYS